MSAERRIAELNTLPIQERDKSRIERVDVDKREFLFFEGDEAKALYIVISGRFALQKLIDSTGLDTVTTALLGPGDIIGLEGLFGAYSTAAVAEEPGKVIKLPVDVILPIIQEDGELMMQVGKLLAQDIREAEENIMDNKMDNVARRVAKTLLKYSRLADEEGRLPATQEEIAHHARTTRESAAKTIATFRSRGLIGRLL